MLSHASHIPCPMGNNQGMDKGRSPGVKPEDITRKDLLFFLWPDVYTKYNLPEYIYIQLQGGSRERGFWRTTQFSDKIEHDLNGVSKS